MGAIDQIRADKKIQIAILVTIGIFALCIYMAFVWPLSYAHSFIKYKENLQTSFKHATDNNSFTVRLEGENAMMSKTHGSSLHEFIVFTVGMGRVNNGISDYNYDREMSIAFGDGSSLGIYEVSLLNEYSEEVPGIMLDYVSPDGMRYTYDSDKTTFEHMTKYVEK